MNRVVLDASAGVEIALQSPDGLQLESLIPRGAVAWVPEHYFVEVSGVIRRRELSGQTPAPLAQIALDRLLASPVQIVSVQPLISEAWTMRNNLTIADALYVVIALHIDAPLVTTDLKLAGAPNLPVDTITL
ncbi:MAG: type II toxin-antitoxin system VapC family toxin [Acidimicrobiales bacterium]|nr:type II toxin-antitoxin system VapC family toxin [Acidimicrobiales bacterium]